MRIVSGLLLGSIILIHSAVAYAAPAKWPPRQAQMLSKNVACLSNAGGAYVKVRTRIAPGVFTITKRKGTSLKKLIQNIKRNQNKLKKKAFRELRPILRKTIRQQKRQASQLTDCAARLGQAIGCSVDAQVPSFLAVIPGQTNHREVTLNSSCSGSLELMVMEPPEKGVVVSSAGEISYHAETSEELGVDGVILRACAVSDVGVIEGCSASIPVNLLRCSISSESSSQSAVENRENGVALNADSSCGSEVQFERVSNAQHGEVSVDGSASAVYTVGYFAGSDSFSYRACDAQGAGCGEPTSVDLTVAIGPSFQGDENSLSPYREYISVEERDHLVRKLAGNRFDMIAGAGASAELSDLLDERFLNDALTAPDLQSTLEAVRDAGVTYGRPIRTEEFIDDWRDDFPGDDQCTEEERNNPSSPLCWKPLIPASLDLNDQTNLHYAMDRWMMTTDRAWHINNHRYHWGYNRMVPYYLKRSRYMNPLHARLMHFWMGHFGTSTEILNGFEENLVGYYVKTIEREALGNFRFMMLGRPTFADANGCAPLTEWRREHGSILCDAASNIWLSNNLNEGDNQNFARELMELYMMSPHDEVMGIDNYTDPFDIVSASRFVSGIRVGQFKNIGGGNVEAARFDSTKHSYFPSSIYTNLSEVDEELPAYDQQFEPGDLVRHILNHHPGVPNFIAAKLFSTFVYPDPSEALVAELGAALKEMDYDIHAFMRMILRSEAMFSPRAAGKNCVSSPLETYSRLLNSIAFPFIPTRRVDQVQNAYATLDANLRIAGESLLGYPTVFTHEYCGRGPGKDGSGSWLQSHLLIFRVTGFTEMLKDFTWAIRDDYDLSESIEVIREFLGLSVLGAEDVLHFFERAFNLSLNEAERDILIEYLTHRRTGGGQINPVTWNEADAALMREKIAGMLVIMSGFHQAGTH